MDTITHALTGAVLAQAAENEKIGNWATIAGVSMGLFPDSDFVLGLFSRQFFIEHHRDFTHSVILIPLYALFFSLILMKVSKRRHFWSFYRICLPVLLSHTFLDLLTSYGTMIVSPLSENRFAWDLLFVVDFFFSGILIVSFLISIFLRERSRWIFRGSILALTFYILFCWHQHERATDTAQRFAAGLNERIIQVASLPQPLSPFRWANYVETEEKVYQGFIDLLRKEIPTRNPDTGTPDAVPWLGRIRRLEQLYAPDEKVQYRSWQKRVDSAWVERALTTEGVKFYYWFARFPVIHSVTSRNGVHRVEFVDVRFLIPEMRMPFAYYVELDSSGKVQSQGFYENQGLGIRD